SYAPVRREMSHERDRRRHSASGNPVSDADRTTGAAKRGGGGADSAREGSKSARRRASRSAAVDAGPSGAEHRQEPAALDAAGQRPGESEGERGAHRAAGDPERGGGGVAVREPFDGERRAAAVFGEREGGPREDRGEAHGPVPSVGSTAAGRAGGPDE